MAKFYLIQVGYSVYGQGDTELEAYTDAVEWLDPVPAFEDVARCTGMRSPSIRGQQYMTDKGTMTDGQLVIVDEATKIGMGFE